MGHPQQALEKGDRCRPTSDWSPPAGPRSAERWWLTALSNISQSISVMITREWPSQAHIILFWAFLEVKAVFRVIPAKLFEKRPSIQWKKQKCSLLSKTHSRCGNTSKLFAFVTMIFAIFRTMFMVSLNKIGTGVLEHEPKVWVAFFIGHPVHDDSDRPAALPAAPDSYCPAGTGSAGAGSPDADLGLAGRGRCHNALRC